MLLVRPLSAGKIGDFERMSNERIPDARKPNGHIWKRVADQVARKSLEWTPWAMYKNLSEFNKQKNSRGTKSFEIEDGSLKVYNKYGDFVVDPASIQNAKTPYFLKVSKIREVIYVTEGVCSIIAYKEWHNTLYKAGYTDSLVQKDEQRLLTIDELEAVDQYFWEMVFDESSREQISIEKAMSRVSMNYRISMELVPKTVFTGSSRQAPVKKADS